MYNLFTHIYQLKLIPSNGLIKYLYKRNRERFMSGFHFICNCRRYRAYKEECMLEFEEEYKNKDL